MELAVALVDRLQIRGVKLRGGDLAPLEEAVRLLGGQPKRVDYCRHAPGAPRKRPPSASGAFARTSSRESESRRDIVVPHVDEIERMRGRRDLLEIELGDDADRVQDLVELAREALDLLGGERKPREPRNVLHVFSRR